jgi:LemA protein
VRAPLEAASAESAAPAPVDGWLSTALNWLAGIGPGAWAVLGLAALLVPWMVGAYNRLMALRNVVIQAWQPAQAGALQRQAAFEPLLAAMREPLAAEHRSLDQWLAHHGEATRALAALSAQPLSAAAAAAWVAAEVQLLPSSSRVLALLDGHPELRLQPEVKAARESWQQAGAQIAFGRQLFNTAAEAHDHALLQWPTRLLMRVFPFRPAGRL